MALKRYPARLSRIGSQFYDRHPVSGDHHPHDEHRAADVVFNAESLAGLEGLRVQIGHEPEIGRDVGRVLPGSVHRDGDYVAATLEIQCSATIGLLDSGALTGEISLGYTCRVEQDAAGVWHQKDIRFPEPASHVALVQRARCGATCSIRKDSMSERVTRHSDGVILDATSCTCGAGAHVDGGSSAERDRIQGFLDHFADLHGVTADAIVREVIRVEGRGAQATKDSIGAAAQRLNPAVNGPAQYVDGTRGPARAPTRLTGDDAFRAQLAAKSGRADAAVALGTDPGASDKIIAAGNAESARLEREHSRSMAAAGQGDTDDAFRAALAKRSRQ